MMSSARAAFAAAVMCTLSAPAHATRNYQAFAVGDPGVPGDGIYASHPDGVFELATPFSLAGASSVTIDVFMDSSVSLSVGGAEDNLSIGLVIPGHADCQVGGGTPYTELTEDNGVPGVRVLVSSATIRGLLDATRYCAGGPFTREQVAIGSLNVNYPDADGNRAIATTLDAVSIVAAAGPANAPYWPLVNGDPGVPGDGIAVSTTWEGDRHYFDPLVTLANVTEGITITLFPGDGMPPIGLGDYDGIGFQFLTPDGMCWISGWEAFDGRVFVNGVEGGHAHMTQQRLEELLAIARQNCSDAANLQLEDLRLQAFYGTASKPDWDGDGIPWTYYDSADAVAVTFGPTGYPGEGQRLADVQLSVSGPVNNPWVNDEVRYEITLRNAGPSPAPQATVGIGVPDKSAVLGFDAPGWSCDAATMTCVKTDPIAVDEASIIVLRYRAPAEPTQYSVHAFVNTGIQDPRHSDNFASVVTRVDGPPPSANLAVSLGQDQARVMAGSTVTYTVQVTNHGYSVAYGVEAELYPWYQGRVLSYAGEHWSCTLETNRCMYLAGLPAGGQASIQVRFETADAEEPISTTVWVQSQVADPDYGDNSATATTDVRKCTAEDYAASTVTPQLNTHGNKVMVKAAVDSGDCGSREQKVMLK